MSDLLEKKVKALKDKIKKLDDEINRLDREDKAGLLSPIERMRLNSLQQEKKELTVKIKELLI